MRKKEISVYYNLIWEKFYQTNKLIRNFKASEMNFEEKKYLSFCDYKTVWIEVSQRILIGEILWKSFLFIFLLICCLVFFCLKIFLVRICPNFAKNNWEKKSEYIFQAQIKLPFQAEFRIGDFELLLWIFIEISPIIRKLNTQ